MTYYNLLEPYDRELFIINKTGTISGSSEQIKKKVTELFKIYELQYKKKVKPGCGKCSGRALRRLAKDYEELQAKATKEEPVVITKTQYDNMTYWELRKLCKDKGLNPQKKDNRQELIDKLNA